MKTFMALYMGSGDPADTAAGLSEADRARGMAAWGEWMQRNADRIVDTGGPLGKTKRAGRDGIADITNRVGAYVVVRAESHDEAVRLFENHPHFSIFPGHSVEVMERLPVPGM
jgi:hypothetical protein